MAMTARERAILDATALELRATAPALASYLADGPEMLRLRGITPAAIEGLVPGSEAQGWRARLRRRLQPRAPELGRPPEPFA